MASTKTSSVAKKKISTVGKQEKEINIDDLVGIPTVGKEKEVEQKTLPVNEDTRFREPVENFDGVVDNTDMDLLYLTISYKPDDE